MKATAMRTWLKSSVFVGLLALGLLGCKQGEGEVCQINEDCEEGLECNAGTRRCQKPGTAGAPDASVGPDAASAARGELEAPGAPLDDGDTAIDQLDR